MTSKQELIHFWKDQGVDDYILEAFRQVPREQFVSPELLHHTYDDRPLPTMRGQSLSQPTTVMIMTQALQPELGDRILEVGAGVGYQAAILSKLAGPKGKVVTVEIIPELVQLTRKNLQILHCHNTTVLETDGSRGVPEEAPFDRVMITCACPTIPEPIIEQTKEGGVIVAPVGDKQEQMMVKATKIGNRLEFEFLGSFVFVPLQGKHGFQ